MDNSIDSSPIKLDLLEKAMALAESQSNDVVLCYSLGIAEGMIYAGFRMAKTSNPRMYQLMGGHWIYIGDYWPYDTVWVQFLQAFKVEKVTDGQ